MSAYGVSLSSVEALLLSATLAMSASVGLAASDPLGVASLVDQGGLLGRGERATRVGRRPVEGGSGSLAGATAG